MGLDCRAGGQVCLDETSFGLCASTEDGRRFIASSRRCAPGFTCFSDAGDDWCRADPASFPSVDCPAGDEWTEHCTSDDRRVVCSGGWVIREFACVGCFMGGDGRANCSS